jgi:hypothetical protein
MCCCRGRCSQGAPGAGGDLAGGGAVGRDGGGAEARVKDCLPRQGSSSLAGQGGSRQHSAWAAADWLASQSSAAAVAGPECGLLGLWRPCAAAEPSCRRCTCGCGCALPAGDAPAAEAARRRPPHARGATAISCTLMHGALTIWSHHGHVLGNLQASSCCLPKLPLPPAAACKSKPSFCRQAAAASGASSLAGSRPGSAAKRQSLSGSPANPGVQLQLAAEHAGRHARYDVKT